jgi:uncharacterized protein YqjF (DUF2071 family)
MKTGIQTWRDLLFVHWEIEPSTLQAMLPRGVEVDTFEGRAYVGVVPFTMDRVRVGPLPIGAFLEANVRTYVRSGGVSGVWFMSLDAENGFMCWGARRMYALPYFKATMRCTIDGQSVAYSSRRTEGRIEGKDASLDARWTVLDRAPHAAASGTLEHFLTERYALFAPANGHGAKRLRVAHAPWPLYRARIDHLETTLLHAAGLPGAKDPIDLVLASPEGVATETFSAQPA